MKAVILAGGFGTRLSEATNLIPKPMVEIGGKPILWEGPKDGGSETEKKPIGEAEKTETETKDTELVLSEGDIAITSRASIVSSLACASKERERPLVSLKAFSASLRKLCSDSGIPLIRVSVSGATQTVVL